MGTALSCIFLASLPAYSQINVETGDETVTIGPGGISVQKRGGGSETVRITPGGIDINGQRPGGNTSLRLSPSGVRVVPSSTQTKSKVTTVRKAAGSGSGTIRTTSATGATLSLEEQVSRLEVSVYGAKTVGRPLLARVEKLETDNLGATGTGSVKARILNLAKVLGVSLAVQSAGTTRPSSIVTTTVRQAPHAASSQSQAASISVAPGSLSITANGSGAASIAANVQDAQDDLVINYPNQTLSYSCHGGDVTINAYNCRVKLSGEVANLVVNGNNNQVTCDKVASVTVNGTGNHVQWLKAYRPDVMNNGTHNVMKPM